MQFEKHYQRALETADKRYARVFEKMGYGKAAPSSAEEVADEQDDTVEAAPKRRGRKLVGR